MRFLLATSNPHKRDEIVAVFDELDFEGNVVLLDERLSELGLTADDVPEPVEDQPTFEGNAQLKARYYANKCRMSCLADDSGLEVDALGGAPGVRSARYSGATGGRSTVDPANNRALLEALGDRLAPQRTARFVCALALHSLDPALPSLVVRGSVEGHILQPQRCADPHHPERGRGDNGFGYDPVFELPADHPYFPGQTTAELTAAQKNRISHRGAATRALVQELTG